MVSRSEVLSALEKVIDPELGLDIVSLGLVYNIEIREDESLHVEYTLTTPGCPLSEVIENAIQTILKEELKIDRIELELVWSPPWRIDFMSEQARLELGFPI